MEALDVAPSYLSGPGDNSAQGERWRSEDSQGTLVLRFLPAPCSRTEVGLIAHHPSLLHAQYWVIYPGAPGPISGIHCPNPSPSWGPKVMCPWALGWGLLDGVNSLLIGGARKTVPSRAQFCGGRTPWVPGGKLNPPAGVWVWRAPG